MSELLDKHRSFLSLLLAGDKKQANSLIQTIIPSQVKVITEIFHNLLTLPLEESEEKEVHKRRNLIKLLANSNKSLSLRKKAIKKHRRQVLAILHHFRNQLTNLLRKCSERVVNER